MNQKASRAMGMWPRRYFQACTAQVENHEDQHDRYAEADPVVRDGQLQRIDAGAVAITYVPAEANQP